MPHRAKHSQGTTCHMCAHRTESTKAKHMTTERFTDGSII